ncbi:MAG TPA: hypothetical protein VMI10_04125 [Terriglobales bacterium]|nr:hypothetical protein [Terriglobales bacterium]
MARGWESKSIEQQQADALDQDKSARPRLSTEEQKRNRLRESLLLSRKRLVGQLAAATRTEHRQMLQQSLAEVDKQLSSFERDADTAAPK